MTERLLYSQGEAAELLGMSTKRLVEQVRAGALRYVLDGRRRKFTRGDLEAYIAACRAGGETWGSISGPTRRGGGGRSQSKVVDIADALKLLRARKRSE